MAKASIKVTWYRYIHRRHRDIMALLLLCSLCNHFFVGCNGPSGHKSRLLNCEGQKMLLYLGAQCPAIVLARGALTMGMFHKFLRVWTGKLLPNILLKRTELLSSCLSPTSTCKKKILETLHRKKLAIGKLFLAENSTWSFDLKFSFNVIDRNEMIAHGHAEHCKHDGQCQSPEQSVADAQILSVLKNLKHSCKTKK